jgi:hypothetical protein
MKLIQLRTFWEEVKNGGAIPPFIRGCSWRSAQSINMDIIPLISFQSRTHLPVAENSYERLREIERGRGGESKDSRVIQKRSHYQIETKFRFDFISSHIHLIYENCI